MKVCDKCRKEMSEEMILQKQYPSFFIEKMTSLFSSNIEINLCPPCSKKFEQWLLSNEENNNNFEMPNEIPPETLKTSE